MVATPVQAGGRQESQLLQNVLMMKILKYSGRKNTALVGSHSSLRNGEATAS
jgi:hypothetical protein